MRTRAHNSPENGTGQRSADAVGLFVAGVQKAGTTSLFAHFCEHPELETPTLKEPHFFDDESVDWNAPDYRRLHACFPDTASRGLRVDATPVSLFWPPSLGRIRSYNPEARLVLLFRDPIERAWSHWCMEYARGAERLPFAEAIRDGRKRLSDDQLSPSWRIHSYVERGLYAEQAARALALFPKTSILWLRSQDLLDRHGDVLAAISDFLGLGPFPDSGPRREFRRADIPYPSELSTQDIRFLAGLFRDDVARFAALTGLEVADWLTVRAD